MFKLWLLLVLVISGFATNVRAEMDKGIVVNTCDPYGFVLKKKRVQESVKSINLSTAFLNTNKVSFTWDTSWSGKMNCLGTSDNAFFLVRLVMDHITHYSPTPGMTLITGLNSALRLPVQRKQKFAVCPGFTVLLVIKPAIL